ncbi:MAG: glycerol-3-phosphate transporter substrate-binding protein [Deltaproteobacteria bacterium]|jgi:sn-glycerol 3-phosphate transport system substrate-binding protein|nr:glycerol-3-phosphate transporter substrate-binding protein [Deltaproteobacteria bacterium]MBP1717068.1 glycerol-3-phosphate transporter substrate-binding protein [Deltaproteobacteria bacterium]
MATQTWKMKFFTIVAALALFGVFSDAAWAKTEVVWWHAMGGFLGERVNDITKKFNASQNEYEVKAINKGSYNETLTAGIAAYRAKTHPQIIQVFEVGTQTMLSSGAIYPVFQLMKDQGIKIDWEDFISVVKTYYSKGGNLYSMPFNSSTPILYYNKTAFEKAGLNPQVAPETFEEIGKAAKAVVSKGAAKIGFTISWPSWTLVENMHTWHDQPFADQQNGFTGMATQLKINGKLGMQVFEMLTRWQKEGIFTYSGRGSRGDQPVINGEAAIGLASTALVGTMTKTSKFDWGTGNLPRLAGYPQGNSIIGGASLWVMKGHKKEVYKGVAKFLEFLGQPEQQAWWHAQTGYFPISRAAIKALPADHFRNNSNLWTAFAQITKGKTTPNSQGIRLGNFAAVRDIIEAEMENTLSGKKSPKEGLDEAVKKGNAVLKEFASMYKQ